MAKHVTVIVKDGGCVHCAECDGDAWHCGPHDCGHDCTQCDGTGMMQCHGVITGDGVPLLMRCTACTPVLV